VEDEEVLEVHPEVAEVLLEVESRVSEVVPEL